MPAPAAGLLAGARPPARRLAAVRWAVEQVHPERVPVTRPVVLAANHLGWLDGPLPAAFAPRPVHVLTKREMFEGRLGPFLGSLPRAAGQVPVDRDRVDSLAVRVALRCLEQGRVVGVFPEGLSGAGDMATARAGAAYLAMVSGAPVVPVAFLGTRAPGGHADSLPPRGTRVAMTYGAPLHLGRRPWPRTQAEVGEAGARVAAAVVETIAQARRATGIDLPGPLGPRPSSTPEQTKKRP